MRSRRPVAVSLVAFTAGLAASAVLRRLAARRRPAPAASATPVTAAPVAAAPVTAAAPAAHPTDGDAVVLTFARRTAAEPARAERPAAPVRCGDNGGRTKAGAPCGARATGGGRCHHHRIAA
jgi:hypothetical protein